MPFESIANGGDLTDLTTQVILTCGVCRVLVIGPEPRALVKPLWLSGLDAIGYELASHPATGESRLPYPDESFDAVVSLGGVEHLDHESVRSLLDEIRRISRRTLILHVDTKLPKETVLTSRRGWEVSAFAAGFRKHPLYYRTNDYASLERDSNRIFIPLEKVPTDAVMRYPMASLQEERDLHMDMLRESGSRSDAHVSRYHFAASFIRPGDAVLDAACGLGYGTYVVRCGTRARSIIGIDASEYGVDYARLNFGSEGASFQQGVLPDCLASIADNSIDHVLCFETLEHVEDPIRLLAEFRRVLTPGGRLTCSVPHDWSDETGADPNPFHFHVYDKMRFVEEIKNFFDLEHLIAQTADRVKQPGGGCVWLKRPRSLTEIEVEQDAVEAEWLLAVVSKSPLNGHQVAYDERIFSGNEQREGGNALAFGRDYSNPWLIRSLVSIGLRTVNAGLRGHWAEAVWCNPAAGAADRGAALCILAYAELVTSDEAPRVKILKSIDAYLADVSDDPNPTVLRWRVSLMYVGGLLALSCGRRDEAQGWFEGVIAAPVAQYSATLLTKPAEAAYLQGLLLTANGRSEDARRTWWEAFRRISTTLGERLTRGYVASPPIFEIRELAAALALCGRLVAAATHAGTQAQRPSVFHDECHADSVFQLQSISVLEKMLADLRQDFRTQQLGIDELERGKSWLESQWEAQAVELERRQKNIEVLQSQISALKLSLDSAESQMTALNKSFLFRAAKKLGLLGEV